MSSSAASITDRNSLRDILGPLLSPRLIVDGLESLRVGIEGNVDSNEKTRFVDGLESSARAEREGNADDAGVRKFMELLDSESLLGWNDMLLGSLIGEGRGRRKVEAMCSRMTAEVFCEG
jgi:hypothetical protein